jgi:serpin B
MPKSGSLTDFVSGMSTSDLSSIVSGLQRREIDLRLPKFKTTATLDLNDVLGKLGMTTAFTDDADFSKMSAEGLKVGAVVQRDYLSVAEKGTEAAAATGIVMEPTAARVPAPTVSFDHPFLFLIRDTTTGAILFASRIQNPASG